MRYLFFILYLFVALKSKGQIISTIAGTGTMTNDGDGGLASIASISYPCYSVFDKHGNYYISTGINGKTVRKIDANGIISTVAGINGMGGNSGDGGPASIAKFNNPQGVAIDSDGNIYVADAGSHVVRRIDATTGIIMTACGDGTANYGGDGGPAVNSKLNNPNGMCFDKYGNLYIADYGNNRVRKINTAGIITTFAGTGNAGYNGDGGWADTSEIRGVFDVAADMLGNIYLADEANNRIRKVGVDMKIHTVAGNGIYGYTGDGTIATNAAVTPHDITVDRFGNLFMCDLYENKIRIINTHGYIEHYAGTGAIGFSGDGSPPTSASFKRPHKIALDTCNNVYVSDLNNYRIRKVTYPYCHYLAAPSVSASTHNISIHPNPTNDNLTIELQTTTNYTLLSIVGTTLQQGQLQAGSNTISLAGLPAGIYLLHLNDEHQRTVHKILKQ